MPLLLLKNVFSHCRIIFVNNIVYSLAIWKGEKSLLKVKEINCWSMIIAI